MSNSNKKKSTQLGMNHATAAGRLRKMVMFDMMQALEINSCHQCGKKIERIEDLSIEHKIPWLDSEDPVGLYFDLNNIAFSHLKCNSGSSRRNAQRINIGASGYRGVSYNKHRGAWEASISLGGENKKHLGYFNSPRIAAQRYDKVAMDLFGLDAITNKSLNLLS